MSNSNTAQEQFNPMYAWKGNTPLDTDDRLKEFTRKSMLGWEEQYKDYSRLWLELPQKYEIGDYPLHVDLELASICNLRCPMCFTLNQSFKDSVNQVFMDFNLFQKVIDEIAGKVYKVNLGLRGESTLHPRFIEAVAYAKTKEIYEVTTITNASRLYLNFFIESVKAGIDRFTISIDGLEQEYDKIRKPLKFKDILNKLKAIKDYKEQNNLIKPLIKVQGVWPAIRPNPSEYYNTIAPFVDLVTYIPLSDWRHQDTNIVYVEQFSCPVLYQRLVVGADGQVIMCLHDQDAENILGNAHYQTIYDIWHGQKFMEIRESHKRENFRLINTCRKCLLPRKTVGEKAIVNGRDIWIENYINRNQVIDS